MAIDPNEIGAFITTTTNTGYLVQLKQHIENRLQELGVHPAMHQGGLIQAKLVETAQAEAVKRHMTVKSMLKLPEFEAPSEVKEQLQEVKVDVQIQEAKLAARIAQEAAQQTSSLLEAMKARIKGHQDLGRLENARLKPEEQLALQETLESLKLVASKQEVREPLVPVAATEDRFQPVHDIPLEAGLKELPPELREDMPPAQSGDGHGQEQVKSGGA